MYFAVLEFFGLSEDILDTYVIAFCFGDDDIFENRLPIKNHFEFTHLYVPQSRRKNQMAIKLFLERPIRFSTAEAKEKFSLTVVLLCVFDDFQCNFFGFHGVFSCYLRFLVVKDAVYEVLV